MKGFTKLEDPSDVQVGDVLLLPPERRALHVTVETLRRHGLSCGVSGRADNDSRFVSSVFSETEDTGAALMVEYVRTQDAPEAALIPRGANTLSAYEFPKKKTILRMGAHLLDEDMLPSITESRAILPVKPLADTVLQRFRTSASPETYQALEATSYVGWRGLTSTPVSWPALHLLAHSVFWKNTEAALSCLPRPEPEEGESSYEHTIVKRLFCSDYHSEYRSSRSYTLALEQETIYHLLSNGMEVHRPTADTWALLADKVLSRHAEQAMQQIGKMNETIATFTTVMKKDIEKFDAMAKWWARRTEKLSSGKSYIKSPYAEGET